MSERENRSKSDEGQLSPEAAEFARQVGRLIAMQFIPSGTKSPALPSRATRTGVESGDQRGADQVS